MQIKDLLSLLDTAVSIVIKVRDAKRAKDCDHHVLLLHQEIPGIEHRDEPTCPCKPRYQCFKCSKTIQIRG
jgi:hypothetical protein